MAEIRFKEYLNHLAALQGIDPIRLNAVVNTYTSSQIYNILEKYGYSMLGILIVMAENNLPSNSRRWKLLYACFAKSDN